jgi:hypothetical protein
MISFASATLVGVLDYQAAANGRMRLNLTGNFAF